MALPRFFPETKIHEFTYIPRYYDEVQDEINQRVDQINAEMGVENGDDSSEYKHIITKGTFHRRFERDHREMKQRNLRIFVFAVILTLILYFVNRYFGFI